MTLGSEESSAAQSADSLPSLACLDKHQPIRILFVEDDEYYRETLTEELGELGFSVKSFPDGAAILESLDTMAEADAIVLDWGLPKTTGIDRRPQRGRHGVTLPVVFLTGRALTDYESLAFDRGALDFIDRRAAWKCWPVGCGASSKAAARRASGLSRR